MSQKIKCLNEENVRLLCSFINKTFSKDEIIDDINIKSDGVFSSYYTTKLLQQLKADNENYTNTVFGELTHLTCEETNILPTLDNTEVNTLYLYSATLTSPYQQYLKISDGNTEKLIDLGSTSISLSEYMKAIDIANTYTTKIETQAIVDTIGDKTDLETTAKDTLVSAINEIKEGLDNCVTKDAIVTTLDSTVTDEQVASAKVVYDGLESKIDADKIATTINDTCTNEQISSAKAVNDLVLGLFASNYNYKNTTFLKNTFGNDSNSSTIYTDANELPAGLQSASDLINAPTSGYVYYLTLFFNGDSRFRVQLGIPIMSYDIHIRYMTGSAWSEWKKLALATG